MKVLHLSNNLLRDITGGTEVFAAQLIQQQAQHQLLWAAHQNKPDSLLGFDQSQGLPLYLLPSVVQGNRLATVTHRCAQAPGFAELLQQFQPHIVHFHSLSHQCGLTHIELAKAAGAKVVMTVHAPGFTCMQGSLLYHRKNICDGVIRDRRCTECRLVNGGLPVPLAHVASAYDWPQLSSEAPGKLLHVLTARQVTAAFRRAWAEVVAQVDAFHVLCNWSREVLQRNGVPNAKIHLIRTAGPEPLPPKQRQPMEDGVLRCVYWGRCAEVKGIHIIIDAVKQLPQDLPIEVSFYGPHWHTTYGQEMLKRIGQDSRFIMGGNLPKEHLLPKLQDYDIALVPSTWLETGPLTVLEAFAAGLAVVGSNLGGIQELLQNQPGCFLLSPHAPSWSRLLADLSHSPSRLKAQTRAYRRFQDVADALSTLYTSFV